MNSLKKNPFLFMSLLLVLVYIIGLLFPWYYMQDVPGTDSFGLWYNTNSNDFTAQAAIYIENSFFQAWYARYVPILLLFAFAIGLFEEAIGLYLFGFFIFQFLFGATSDEVGLSFGPYLHILMMVVLLFLAPSEKKNPDKH